MKKGLVIWAMCVLAITGMLFYQGLKTPDTIGEAQAVQRQGDKHITVSSVSALHKSLWNGAMHPMLAGAAARDPNAQLVLTYVHAVGNRDSENVEVWEKSPTDYMTLSVAYCGGTTSNITVANNRWNGLTTTSGQSYICIDNGAGQVGWGELRKANLGTEAHYADGGGIVTLLSRSSNFALGPYLSSMQGQPDLSGVTFGVGSRVYLMKKCGQFHIGSGSVARESKEGLFAITKDSPALFTMEADLLATTSGAGTSLCAVSGSYVW